MQLPDSTHVNRFIAKEKFYSKTTVTSSIRQLFTDEIEKITWTHKISADTLNITAGEYTELQVFELSLKGSEVSTALLKHIDTFIPYPILYIAKRASGEQAILSYKESSKAIDQMKVDSYYRTAWQQTVNLELIGRSVDEIYKNYLFQIEPTLKQGSSNSLRESVDIKSEKAKILRQIDALNRKIRSEPSVAKKQELAREKFNLEQNI